MLDLDAYFARIGLPDLPRDSTVDTLHVLSRAHVQAIPFENIDVLLGRPVRLDLPSLEAKLVGDRRGGYCFEQNTLMLGVLRQLGFQARLLGGRVRYQRPREYTPPRTHVLVRVEVEGEAWLVDVGMGGLSLTAAIRLDREGPQATPHDERRIVREGDLRYQQLSFGGDWLDVCEFTLDEMHPIDCEVGNWFTSTSPQSPFKNRLLVARALANGGRATLLNHELTLRASDGNANVRALKTHDELRAVLAEYFGIELPAGTRVSCPELHLEEA